MFLQSGPLSMRLCGRFTLIPTIVLIGVSLAAQGYAQGDRLPGEIAIELGGSLVFPQQVPTIRQIASSVEAGKPSTIAVLKMHHSGDNHYAPAWSSDGRAFAFLRSDLTVGTRKAVVQSLGGTATTLYDDRTSFEDLATWSGGTRSLLVFDSTNEPTGRHNIHQVAVDAEPERITDDAGVIDFPVMHSGALKNYLVFRRDRELYLGQYEVGKTKPDSLDSLGEGEEAQLSPNGKFLCIVRRTDLGNVFRLEIRELAGPREKVLHKTSDVIVRNPRFSPDGRYVAFHARPTDQNQWSLWLVPANGSSAAVQLASDVRAQEDFQHVGPSWSPSSQGLWYFSTANSQAHYELKYVSVRDGQSITVEYPSNITSASDAAINPNPQRPLIIFAGHTDRPRDIYAILLSRSR